MRRLACILPALLLPLTVSLRAASPDWAPVTQAELADNAPQLEPQAAAEILSYRLEVNESIDRTLDFLYHIRIKVYDPARATSVTRLNWFYPGTQDNPGHEIEARLTLPDGTSRIFGDKDVLKINGAEEGHADSVMGWLHASSRLRITQNFLPLSGVEKGSIIDVWERAPSVSYTNWMQSSIQRDIPIRQFEYLSHYRPNDEVLHRVFLLNPHGGQLTHDEKAGEIRFTAANLPSIADEDFGPPLTYISLTIIQTEENRERGLYRVHVTVPLPDSVAPNAAPWVFFATAKDFQDADKGYVTRKVRKKAEALVDGITDPKERVRRIYYYVQGLYQKVQHRADLENWYTRYIDSLDDLVDLGDIDSAIIRPEDFHYLFVAMLRAAGIECHSVFHPDRTAFPFSEQMVCEYFLNYWTVAVNFGGEIRLYDPCAEVPLAAGTLPWKVEGLPALMAASQKQVFLTIPPAPAESSAAETSADLTLAADGGLAGDCVRTFTGHRAEAVRGQLRQTGREQWWTLARGLLGLEDSAADIRLETVEGLDAPDEPVRIHASVHWAAYAPLLRDRVVLPLAVWAQGRPPLFSARKRTTRVFFDFPQLESEKITIHLPENYQPDFLPQAIAAHSKDFAYDLSVTHDRAHRLLQLNRTFTTRVIDIPVEDYAKARDWVRLVSVADQIAITLSARHSPPKA